MSSSRHPAAKRRRQEEEMEDRWDLTSNRESLSRTTSLATSENLPLEVPKKSYQVYNILSQKQSVDSVSSNIEGEESILVSMYNNTNGRMRNSKQSFEMGNAWMQPSVQDNNANDTTTTSHSTFADASISGGRSFKMNNGSFIVHQQMSDRNYMRSLSTPAVHIDRHTIVQPQASANSPSNFKEWTRIYLFGREHNTGAPRIQSTS